MAYILDIEGMTCAVCASHVEDAALSVPGVQTARVNLLQNTLLLEVDATYAKDVGTLIERVGEAIAKAGYRVVGSRLEGQPTGGVRLTEVKDASDDEMSWQFRKTVIALVCAAFVFWMGASVKFNWPFMPITKTPSGYVGLGIAELLVSIPVILLYRDTFVRGARALVNKAPTMDSLIFLSVGVSLCYALYNLFVLSSVVIEDPMGAHRYLMGLTFDSAVMIVSLVGLGKYFEKRAKHRTTDALRSLMELAPSTATIERDGVEVTVSTDALAVGDICIVKAGDTIPADGEVIEGSGSCDESALTGESLPVFKQVGSQATGGTILVSGWLKVQVVRVGADTELSAIVRLVEEATSSKAPVQRVADKIAQIFVPAVMTLSALTFIVWMLSSHSVSQALNYAISVLVISCPCALGLAVPTALMVGSGRGAQMGILIKSAETLEQLAGISAVVFDKTGTLTQGKPYLERTYLVDGLRATEADVLALAASLESKSSHPLAEAFSDYIEEDLSTSLDEFEILEGMGIKAQVDSREVALGNKRIQVECPIEINADDLQKTLLYLVDAGGVKACFVIDDKLKSTAPETIDALKTMGVEPVLLSGDKQSVAERVGRELGIDRVIAEVLPQDKDTQIQKLKAQGYSVAMVGDGINDAPALVRADVGIAIGAGRDVALDNADVILMKSDPLDVARALEFSRAVMRNIHQNLFWALIYNVILIPIAAGVPRLLGFSLTMNPMLGALAMSMSSLFVVTNALRLKTWTSTWSAQYKSESKTLERQTEETDVIEDITNTDQKETAMNKVELNVEGMMCQMCVKHAREALEAIPGASNVVVDLESKSASVELPEGVSSQTAVDAIEKAGYTAHIA